MQIILAGPRGFCAGVNMAVESLERAIERFGTPLYVYHEIVHNRWVVERFRRRGVVFVDDLEDVPQGAPLLYSAHGVSPKVRQIADQRGLQTIDATCPLVTKVHTEAVRYAQLGYTIVLIGHEGHDEVSGTMGEAPDRIRLVRSGPRDTNSTVPRFFSSSATRDVEGTLTYCAAPVSRRTSDSSIHSIQRGSTFLGPTEEILGTGR